MLGRRPGFKGGHAFKPAHRAAPLLVEELPLPARVVIPIQQGFGEALLPQVNPGSAVQAGQVIAEDEALVSSPILASINGTVKEIVSIAHRGQEQQAVVIESNGQADWQKLEGAVADPDDASPDALGDVLYRTGVSGLGRCGIPTRHRSSNVGPDEIDHLVITAVNADPYALGNATLLAGNVERFVTGLKVLRRALGGVSVSLGISRKDRQIADEIRREAGAEDWLHVVPLKPKYPQDWDEVIIETLLGLRVPDNGSATDVGVTVLDVRAVFHAYEAVVEGKPLIQRIISVGGSATSGGASAVTARIGTPLETILNNRLVNDLDARVVLGGLLVGTQEAMTSPITRASNSVIAIREEAKRKFMWFLRPGIGVDSFSRAFLNTYLPSPSRVDDTNLHGEPRPCVACGYCEDVCPRPLIPHLLSKTCTHGVHEEAAGMQLNACIECGLCSYVCPSKIPLMGDIQEGKRVWAKMSGVGQEEAAAT